jgi:hypothetical protein
VLRPARKPDWPALRATVVAVLGERWPAVAFEVAAADAPPSIAWEDGPAEGSVAGALGEVPGWRCESTTLGPDPDAPRGLTALRLDRRLSTAALAVGVVRFQASHARPYDATRPDAVADLWAILEEDDPADCPYPIPAAMARELLAGWDGPADAGALAARLRELGYDRLWNLAWSTVEL